MSYQYPVRALGMMLALAAVIAFEGGAELVAASVTLHILISMRHISTWQIVKHISGTSTHVPTHAPAGNFPDGALLGNGCLGVSIQGKNTDHISLFLGREDFWSLYRGRIMPFGRVQFSISALHNGSYITHEKIGPAEVTGQIATGADHALRFSAWVAKPQNLLVLRLHNTGRRSLKVNSQLLDGWKTTGAAGTSGQTEGISWLKVSPDTVRACVGRPTGQDRAIYFNGGIKDLRVYADTRGEKKARLFSFLPGQPAPMAKPKGNTRLDCGFLRMPQRAMCIRVWVYPRSTRGNQAIFSAMTGQRWPQHGIVGGYPRIPYGVSLSLEHGKASVLFNRVRVTAAVSLPMHQWSKLAATYDGKTLALSVAGRHVAQSSRFPTTAQVAGPQWDWNAIHTGDNNLAYDGCGPKGLLAMRWLGDHIRWVHGIQEISIPAGGVATAAVSAIDNHDVADYRAASLRLLVAMRTDALAGMWEQHLAWWKTFWNKSAIEIPDKKIEAYYYGSLYLLACSSAPGQVAPGLWGNFITSPNMAWNGDYTLDYNYEATFWAAYPTNHGALADNYDLPLLAWMARGRGLAKSRGYRGLYYYCHLTPPPGWSGDGSGTERQKSDALFSAVDCLMRWRYTHSRVYARKIFPFLRGVATYWDHYLVMKNGVYMDVKDGADEGSLDHDVNPATNIAFLRMLYAGLLEMNRTLAMQDPSAEKWRHILRHLAPLPIFPAAKVFGPVDMAGKLVIRYTQQGTHWSGPVIRTHWGHPGWHGVHGSSAGMNPVQTIFPGWAIGLESSPRLLKAGLDTIQIFQIWYDYNDDSSYYPAAACVGYNPIKILHHLDTLISHCAYPNFVFQMGGGGTENFAIVPTTICAMFLQSYQKNIHVFPDWPLKQDAAFQNLLACGDFLVSSRVKAGQITYVSIVSRRGGVCRVVNPWPGRRVVVGVNGGAARVIAGKVLKVITTKDDVLAFESQ